MLEVLPNDAKRVQYFFQVCSRWVNDGGSAVGSDLDERGKPSVSENFRDVDFPSAVQALFEPDHLQILG